MRRLPFALLCLATLCASAQTKPNFSGTWKLNAGESDYGDKRVAVPDKLMWTIDQHSNAVNYTVAGERAGRKTGFMAAVQIGGVPFESDEAGIITMEWKGDTLAVDTLYNPQNERRSSMNEIWTLSEDGKKLVDQVIYHMPQNAKNRADVVFKRVFDRQ